MRIEPHCTAKRLSETEPGELVRYPISNTAVSAIVVSVGLESKPGVVFLHPVTDDMPPPWVEVRPEDRDLVVLSFGRNYFFRFNPATSRVIAGDAMHPEGAGALLIRESGPALRVNSQGHARVVILVELDLKTGVVGKYRAERQVAVLEWEIHLNNGRDDQPPFFCFHAA